MNCGSSELQFGLREAIAPYAPRLLVTIRNHAHLVAAYGAAFAAAVGRELQARALDAGITSSAASRLGDDGFLLSPYPLLTSESSSRERLLEYVLASLCGPPIEHGGHAAFAVLALRLVSPADVELLTDSDIDNDAAMQPPALAPVQRTDIWRLAYAADMSEAVRVFRLLDSRRLAFAFQPIVARVDFSQQLYQEALIRVLPEDGEPVSMAGSLNALERLGLMRQFDRCVVRTALTILKSQPALCLGCNISAQSAVIDPWWYQVLEDLQADPSLASRLVIEMTESALLPGTDEAVAFVHRLQRLGCRVAMDDFGAGFSTLDFIVRAKPDIIKIDNGYLRRGRSGSAAHDVLTNLVRLCSRLAEDVVIEGIESEADIEAVRPRMDIWIQGHFIGRPKVAPPWHRQAPHLLTNHWAAVGMPGATHARQP